MPNYTLGINCHMTLQHALVNEALPFGFILERDTRSPGSGPAISIQKEVDSAGVIVNRVFFSVLLGDELINPDGSRHLDRRDTLTIGQWPIGAGTIGKSVDTRSYMYAMLIAFLSQPKDLSIVCAAGVLSNLYALGHVSTEMHYGDHSVAVCQLTDIGVYFPPVDLTLFNASIWDGTLTWSTSFWR